MPAAKYRGQEPAQRPFQPRLVQVPGPVRHVQQRVFDQDGIAAVQGQQQPLQCAAQAGVDPAD